ncbi:MAG TPA: tRNA pseudouridine(55) synthase TruB [Ktedonobacteraceae bacterium]|nr:tRNA pseudouridine(55) synthase TruB [Ktedonobacteraceae bacterium]
MDGIFNINKTTGMTSHDVVAKIRKILKQKRAGHAGTLDPAASGVLPICIGQGTRVAEYLSESGKAYQADILFGIVTDTYDSEGSIIRTANTAGLTLANIKETLPHFLGSQMQYPPRYSAIKIQGQPAYKRARAGEELSLAARPITITSLEILAWEPPRLILAIECSKGTYIRSLAYDLGEKLACGAHLAALIRVRSGPFTLSESITLAQLADAVTTGTVAERLFPPDFALQSYPAIRLDAATAARVLHGNPFPYNLTPPPASPPTLARIYGPSNNFLAIAEWSPDQNLWQPKKVFTA